MSGRLFPHPKRLREFVLRHAPVCGASLVVLSTSGVVALGWFHAGKKLETSFNSDSYRISEHHPSPLFGAPATTEVVLGAAPTDVRLDGTLAFADSPERGLALMTIAGRPTVVRVGMMVGGAVLQSVYEDRVVLAGADGAFEVVFTAAVGGHPRRHPVAPPPPPPPKVLEERIESAIQPLESVLKATPLLNGGRYSGLIVTPNGNLPAFRSLGLQPGDVIVAVNRIQLNENSLNLLAEAVESKQPVKVWVVRAGGAGQEVTLNTSVLGY